MPVDTTRLDRLIRKQITQPYVGPGRDLIYRLTLRPMRTVAASFVAILVLSGIFLVTTSSGPAMASATEMARFHQDLVSGVVPANEVNSIDEANRVLKLATSDSPTVPVVPAQHVMKCCMKSVKNKKVACVLLKDQGALVTMVVARAAEIRVPECAMVVRDGRSFHIQSSGSLNMVMTERDGQWVCLIGDVASEKLMDIGGQIRP